MKFQLIPLLAALVGFASAACYVDYHPQSSITIPCNTADGTSGLVMNCDEETASSKGCDDGGASLYLTPTYCCPN